MTFEDLIEFISPDVCECGGGSKLACSGTVVKVRKAAGEIVMKIVNYLRSVEGKVLPILKRWLRI